MKGRFYGFAFMFYLILLQVTSNINSFTQTSARINNTSLQIDNGRLIITYDLVNTKPNERFNVWIDVRKTTGQEIKPKNISGHVGKNIVGGKGLNIIWNFESENIDYVGNINVQVLAELITVHNLKIERILIKSAVFPGWGLHDIEKVNPYLLIGIAGYGSLAATLIYNNKSNITYDKYLESDSIPVRAALYNDFTKQEDATKILGITAAAIWIADIGWATMKYLKKTSKVSSDINPRFRIGYDFYRYGSTPVLTFKYNF
jgi:hypothetical protein